MACIFHNNDGHCLFPCEDEVKEYCVEGPCSEEIDVDNLIKALRCKGQHYEDCAEDGCPYYESKSYGCDCQRIDRDAADAIEKLVSLVKQIQIKDDISSTGRKERT